MPELPEVETTVRGINTVLKGLSITDVWTNYPNGNHLGKKNIKDRIYFNYFKKQIIGKKFVLAKRRAKNILIDISGDKTILIHMKMTGHVLYGKYRKTTAAEKKILQEEWVAESDEYLKDPFNRFLRLVFTLSNGKHLVLSDMRKFAKVCLISDDEKESKKIQEGLGPEPLEKNFTFNKLKERLSKKSGWKIKKALLDQTVISGIGNIYGDEILWQAKVKPERKVRDITDAEYKIMFKAMKEILLKSIKVGGDSMSDYRNIYGKRGGFQNFHKAYRQTGKKCQRKNCGGIIQRTTIEQRSAHFCPVCQY